MNRALIHKIIFGIVMAIYLIVPIVMITRYEGVLADGEVYRFRCMPVDPYDSFRGRYIVLRFQEAEVDRSACSDTLERGDDVYVNISKRDSDFVVINSVSKSSSEDEHFFKAKVQYAYEGSDKITLDFPFDRYYMNEELAPLAEKAIRNNTRWRSSDQVYVDVRIVNGTAVIEEIYINDIPLKEYLAALPESGDQ